LLTEPTLKAARAPSKTAIDCKKLDDIVCVLPSVLDPVERERFDS